MGELAAVLDRLAADDLFTLSDGQLLERTAELIAMQNRLAAEVTRTVRRADLAQAPEHDGLASMPSWQRGHCRMSGAAASALVNRGRALEHLPAIAAGFAAGRVSAEQVALVAKIATPENLSKAAEQDIDLAEIDVALAEVATGQPYTHLVRAVGHYLACLDTDGPEPDPTEGRQLNLSKHPDGRVTGRFDLDPVGGEKLAAALEALLQANRPLGDTRNRSQQLADALVQLADSALAQGNLPFLRTVKPHLVVTIDIEDLLDPTTAPGAAGTGFGATMSAAAARWATCDGGVTRIVLNQDSVPTDHGRTKRIVPPRLRRDVEQRDKHCVFAGCHAPTYWCDVHHIVHWIFGGETNLENSALLCERHHTKVHHGFRVEREVGGRWHTYRPDDTKIVITAPL